MARSSRDLSIRLGVDTRELSKFGVAERRVGRFGGVVGRTSRRMRRFGAAAGRVAAGLGLLAAAAGTLAAIKFRGFVAEADKLGKTSKVIGITAEELQGLQHAGELAGVATEKTSRSLKIYAERLGKARAGTGALAEFLKKTSPRLLRQQIEAESTSEALRDMADAIAAIEDPRQRTALASAAFGQSGRDLVNLLTGGRTGIERMISDARRLGFVIGNEVVERAEKLNDRWTNIGRTIRGLGTRVAIGAMPAIERLTERFEKFLGENQQALGDWAEDVGVKIGEGITNLAESLGRLSESTGGLQGVLESMSGSVDTIADFVDSVNQIKEFWDSTSEPSNAFWRWFRPDSTKLRDAETGLVIRPGQDPAPLVRQPRLTHARLRGQGFEILEPFPERSSSAEPGEVSVFVRIDSEGRPRVPEVETRGPVHLRGVELREDRLGRVMGGP